MKGEAPVTNPLLLPALSALFPAEGLLASNNDVVVVAARNAWPEYQGFLPTCAAEPAISASQPSCLLLEHPSSRKSYIR